MGRLVRVTISLEENLFRKFDRLCARRRYTNRSEAVRDLIRDRLVADDCVPVGGRAPVAAAILLVYDHHQRELLGRIVDLQHDFAGEVITASHVHWTHDTCLEVIIAKGRPAEIQGLADSLISLRGVQHGRLVTTSPGAVERGNGAPRGGRNDGHRGHRAHRGY